MQPNHPIEWGTRYKTIQRLNYIHQNPVEMGFVEKAEEWLHSFVEIIMVEVGQNSN